MILPHPAVSGGGDDAGQQCGSKSWAVHQAAILKQRDHKADQIARDGIKLVASHQDEHLPRIGTFGADGAAGLEEDVVIQISEVEQQEIRLLDASYDAPDDARSMPCTESAVIDQKRITALILEGKFLCGQDNALDQRAEQLPPLVGVWSG